MVCVVLAVFFVCGEARADVALKHMGCVTLKTTAGMYETETGITQTWLKDTIYVALKSYIPRLLIDGCPENTLEVEVLFLSVNFE